VKFERLSSAATISRYDRVVAIGPELIQQKLDDARSNARKREIHVLHRGPSDGVQRMLNAVETCTYIRPHRHADPPKTESLVLLSGSIGFITFLDDATLDNVIHLHPEKAIALDCREGVWHTMVAFSPSVVFEVKTGPHTVATDKEFAAWAPDESAGGAQEYLAHLKTLFQNRKD
jgi:cupin fold WbuC family metalloprotein